MALRHDPCHEGQPPLRLAAPLAVDDMDDVFEDAEEQLHCRIDLALALKESEIAMKKFFNNDFEGARDMMMARAQTSIYHSLGSAVFEFIPAVLTFEQSYISSASAALKNTVIVCNQYRRNSSLFGTMLKKPNYSQYTDLEAHAELCHAESLLLQASLTIMEDEDLTALIRSTIKVKNAFTTFKDCSKILEKKSWESEMSRVHFHSGVRMGIGTFNLMISLLPPKIISLLEFVGFAGNKALGLAELEAGFREKGLRLQLCNLTLLGYHLIICHFIGAEPDLDICEEIINRQLLEHPNGVWFLLFKGRLEFMRGQLDDAKVTYAKAIASQNVWKQLHHLCCWELIWVYSMKSQWREAAAYGELLLQGSMWSRTIYSYARAALLLQNGDAITDEERTICTDLLRNASFYKQRIAGKSLPMEKFMIKRSARYRLQNNHLVLPGLEMLCLWNMFDILSKSPYDGQNILKEIERERKQLEQGVQPWEAGFEVDNRALACYLHGCCLRALGLPHLALQALEQVPTSKSSLKEDTFLVPYALAEKAYCYHGLGENDLAVQMLKDIRKKHSGYSLESRLHFRIHSKLEILKAKPKASRRDSDPTLTCTTESSVQTAL